MKNSLKLIFTASAAVAALVACGGDSSSSDPVKVAAADTTVSASAASIAGVSGQTFNFPSGVPALGLSGASSVKLTSASSTTTSPTFSLTSGTGTAAGNLGFGSCVFAITSSNIPGVTVGQTITVNPCQYNVATKNVQATGQATTVQVLLNLGITPSAANQASVAIDPTTGVVTVNNVNTGVSVTLAVTGATGG